MTPEAGQYDTSAPLEARISLHDRFSRNPQGWFPWLRALVSPFMRGHVLDAGCGTGTFWQGASGLLAHCTEISPIDSSAAMVDVARVRVGDDPRFRVRVCDAQELPFADGSFDLVTAFHMLYDVPDMTAALAEFARVVATDGMVAISTNGIGHLRELDELLAQFVPEATWGDIATRFTLENAESLLAPTFTDIQIHRYEDELWITDAEAVVDWAAGVPGASDLSALRTEVTRHIEREGGLRVTKSSGCILLTSMA